MKIEEGVSSARRFLAAQFPECDAAFLAGSVVRGDATPTSDLDIVVLTSLREVPYRESFVWESWPVEASTHEEKPLMYSSDQDARRYLPSLQQMCAEGIVLRGGDGLAARIKEEARRQLEAGPEP